MTEIIKVREKAGIMWVIVVVLLFMILAGCTAREKTFTIGIVSNVPADTLILQGFKDGMVKLGYIEGKNIKYIYNRITKLNEKNIDVEIKKLLTQNVDLLLTTGNQVALQAKQLVKGTNTPVLFSSNAWPVESGLIEKLNHPGGNLTGIRLEDSTPKALEFLKISIPGLKKVYVPYNPDDAASIDHLPRLNNAASQLGIELDLQKIHSVEETVAAIARLPEDVDAIFMISSPTLNSRSIELSQAAIKRRMPTGSILFDDEVLMSFTIDFLNVGKMQAQLAHQIFQGAKPADLPVETSDVLLIVNLKTAEKLGIHIPGGVLAQAKTIIR